MLLPYHSLSQCLKSLAQFEQEASPGELLPEYYLSRSTCFAIDDFSSFHDDSREVAEEGYEEAMRTSRARVIGDSSASVRESDLLPVLLEIHHHSDRHDTLVLIRN